MERFDATTLTPFPGVIYQGEQDVGGPGNVGWENFALEQKNQVKRGKIGQKWAKKSENFF